MMKKKLFSLAVTLVMALSLAVPAMAADITIENPAPNETYTAYKIFDVTKSALICGQEEGADHTHSDNCYSFSYSILTTNPWYNTVVQYANANDETDADGLTLVPVASDSGKFTVDFDNSKFSAAAFAAALNVAKDTVSDEGYTSVGSKITVPDAGYYFVDTTLGSLCSLLTSDSSQELVEKNSIPSLTKKVQEDSNITWGEKATAEYGQSVEFQLTVNTGTSNGNGTGVDADYVITDVIPSNMTLDNNAADGEPSYITLPAGWTKGTDYTESYDDESRTLTITLKQAKLATLGEDFDIVITYSATLNSTAVVGKAETNTATLTYKAQTSQDTADVVTYNIGGTAEASTITKVDGEDKALAGVKFVLMNGEKYATFDDNMKLTGWVDTQEKATELVTDEDGHIYAYGLDAGTYTLKETYTLPGYNLLNDTITAVIAEDGTVTYKYTSSEGNGANSIEIVNESGAILPGTGGMGTTIFYVVGGTLVVAAAVLLITKKRMHNVED